MLAHLLKESGTAGFTTGPLDVQVQSITSDSRQVVPEALFVALRGLTVDGHDFIDAAIEQGARAVVAETPAPVERPEDLAWIQVQNLHWRWQPSRPTMTFSTKYMTDAGRSHRVSTLPRLYQV